MFVLYDRNQSYFVKLILYLFMVWPSIRATDVGICLPSDLPKMREDQTMLVEKLHFIKRCKRIKDIAMIRKQGYLLRHLMHSWQYPKALVFSILFLVISTVIVLV